MASNQTGEAFARELRNLLNRALAAGVHLTGSYGDGEPQTYTVEWRSDENNFWQTREVKLGDSHRWEARGL